MQPCVLHLPSYQQSHLPPPNNVKGSVANRCPINERVELNSTNKICNRQSEVLCRLHIFHGFVDYFLLRGNQGTKALVRSMYSL